MKQILLILVVSLIFSSCTQNKAKKDFISPIEAIQLAAEAAELTESSTAIAKGVFALTIQATGSSDKMIYLNSELDYRDQRNLTIAIPSGIANYLTDLYGSKPQDFFKGKSILVNGEAKRVRINFTTYGKPSNKYYYQTQVPITSADQIKLAK